MNTPLSNGPENDADRQLDALLRMARSAPLPPVAERLALGFGTRVEARLTAAAEETAMISRLLWRWVSALGACAAMVVALATLTPDANGSETMTADASFQSDWASYTEVPDVWTQE
jgi:hypothetical protein